MADFIDYQLDPQGQPRFYGIFKAKVVSADDPLGKKRLMLNIPMIYGQVTSDWAPACLPPIDNSLLVLPSEGDTVWVMFEAGNPDFPVWIGVR